MKGLWHLWVSRGHADRLILYTHKGYVWDVLMYESEKRDEYRYIEMVSMVYGGISVSSNISIFK